MRRRANRGGVAADDPGRSARAPRRSSRRRGTPISRPRSVRSLVPHGQEHDEPVTLAHDLRRFLQRSGPGRWRALPGARRPRCPGELACNRAWNADNAGGGQPPARLLRLSRRFRTVVAANAAYGRASQAGCLSTGRNAALLIPPTQRRVRRPVASRREQRETARPRPPARGPSADHRDRADSAVRQIDCSEAGTSRAGHNIRRHSRASRLPPICALDQVRGCSVRLRRDCAERRPVQAERRSRLPSRPATRIVGEPGNREARAASESTSSITGMSASTPRSRTTRST
jgi:hypothetical protein